MEPIKDAVKVFLEQLQRRQHLVQKDSPEMWLKNVLTKRELKHIKYSYFKRGILGISVDSSTWMYYFGAKKDGLLNQLKRQSNAIKDIRLRLGEVK